MWSEPVLSLSSPHTRRKDIVATQLRLDIIPTHLQRQGAPTPVQREEIRERQTAAPDFYGASA